MVVCPSQPSLIGGPRVPTVTWSPPHQTCGADVVQPRPLVTRVDSWKQTACLPSQLAGAGVARQCHLIRSVLSFFAAGAGSASAGAGPQQRGAQTADAASPQEAGGAQGAPPPRAVGPAAPPRPRIGIGSGPPGWGTGSLSDPLMLQTASGNAFLNETFISRDWKKMTTTPV